LAYTVNPVEPQYWPSGLGRHRERFAEATVVEYVPAGQFVQLPADTPPEDSRYFPATHVLQLVKLTVSW
jgi:hypothetical protein